MMRATGNTKCIITLPFSDFKNMTNKLKPLKPIGQAIAFVLEIPKREDNDIPPHSRCLASLNRRFDSN